MSNTDTAGLPESLSVRPTLIVFGNCQAEAITSILCNSPELKAEYDIHYLRSFVSPTEGTASLEADVVSRCALLFEQHDPKGFPYEAQLPDECGRVRFPATDFNLLWPLGASNPFNDPPSADFPWGHFPYGDWMVINCVERGIPEEECIRNYFSSADYIPNLDRLLAVETARIRARDAHCQVKIGNFILQNFRASRMFWCQNHPATNVLREITSRLLSAGAQTVPLLGQIEVDSCIIGHFPPEGPLGVISVPIHPAIVDHFGLDWYDAGEPHRVYGGHTYTYREYFEAYIHNSYEVKKQRQDSVAS